MQTIEEFMLEFFRARIANEEREIASRAPFRQKYFTNDCKKDSRAGALEKFQSEEVVSVSESDSEVAVITTFKSPFHKPGDQTHRERYLLKVTGDGWLIWKVELECPICHGQGDVNCVCCKGEHWK
jgi:hypothetical protein